jgi:hypothetical protein
VGLFFRRWLMFLPNGGVEALFLVGSFLVATRVWTGKASRGVAFLLVGLGLAWYGVVSLCDVVASHISR